MNIKQKPHIEITDTECLDLMTQYPDSVSYSHFDDETKGAAWIYLPPDATLDSEGTLVESPREGCKLLKQWTSEKSERMRF